jgi:hypothetical protein
MKKEDLIKKARERGITIDETQAEKYITLSDEELANLAVSGGGCNPPQKLSPVPPNSVRIDYPNHGYNCLGFIDKTPKLDYAYRTCEFCGHSVKCYVGELETALFCTNTSVWE